MNVLQGNDSTTTGESGVDPRLARDSGGPGDFVSGTPPVGEAIVPVGEVEEASPQGSAPPTSTIIYSRGSSKYDNRPAQCEAGDFAEFVERIAGDRAVEKGQQFFCAAFEVGQHRDQGRHPEAASWRQAHLARPRRFLPVDIDGMAEPAAFAELMDLCSRFRGMAYTTASHTAEAPRCRMVFELDRATDRGEGIHLGQAFRMLVEAERGEGRYIFDKSVFQAEQPCYMPPVHSEIFRFEGAPLEVDALLERFPQAAVGPRAAGEGAGGGDHEGWLNDLLAGANVHDSLRNLVARWVAQGLPDEAIHAQAQLLLKRVGEIRGAERVEAMLRDGELDRMIQGARNKGFAPRAYAEILADCEALTAESDIVDIRALVVEAGRALDPLEQERVFHAIKSVTGLGKVAIRAMAAQGDGEPDPDHLDIARSLIAEVGRENLVETGGQLWQYNGHGLWEPREERGVRQLVQAHVDGHFPAVRKTQNLITSVGDVLRNEMYRPGHEWDVGPADSVNFLNGELFLEGGRWERREHSRKHYRTAQVPYDYGPETLAPRFEKFIDEVFEEDPDKDDKKQLIREMLGYTLMAHSRYERAIILEGSGRNGKSVLLRVVEALCGADNISFVQPSQMDRVFQRHFLRGKLANIVTEISQGAMLQDAEIKALTSGEASTTEGKNRDPQNTRVFATFWFGTNHLPHTRDVSDAMTRRILIVPFNRKFVHGENADPRLMDTLLGELPGIARLALDAYAGVVERGDFTVPASSAEASLKWLQAVDQIRCFIDEACERNDNEKATANGLYRAYKLWVFDVGIKNAFTRPNFNQRMEQMGFLKRRESEGNFYYGISHPEARPPKQLSFEASAKKLQADLAYRAALLEIEG